MGHKRRPTPSYRDAIDRLFAARRFGVDLGLERIEALLARLDNCHQRIATRIVIGGTNGKGSTSAFVEAIAMAAGRRTGVFSSPHLARFTERFRVMGESASEDEVAKAAARVTAAGGDELTFFEQCTAIAAVLFAARGVDFGIFEVGLGGRLDSTKAIAPELVAISGVAYDHQTVLGDTLEAIAVEKVGAADPGVRLIFGRGGAPGSLQALLEAAAARGLEPEVARPLEPEVELGLRGAFQRPNAALARAVAKAFELGSTAIETGLALAKLPGRFETISTDPELIVDGAHNPDAARALADAISQLPSAPTTVLLAVSADKDAAAIARALAEVADRFVLSRARSDRALPTDALAEAVRSVTELPIEVRQPEELLAAIRSHSGRVVACGSLHFIGDLRARWLGDALDDRPLTDPGPNK